MGKSRFLRHSAVTALLAALAWPAPVAAQNCLTGADLDAGARHALEQTAHPFFRMSANGDYAALKSAAIASLASNFSGVETAVGDHKADFAGAQASPAAIFVLENTFPSTMQRAEFYCGIFNSQERVGFVIPNLAPGRYAVVTENISGGQQPVRLTLVLQQQGNRWALAGYTVKPTQVAGHEMNWYLSQARRYKAGGQNMTAQLYYLEAWYLSQPVDIEYTIQQDQLADEMQPVRPPDWPSPQQPMTLMDRGRAFRVTQIFPDAVGNDLYVIVKYQATTDLSNTPVAFQDNLDVIKALLARYPELRSAFSGVVARAVDPAGRDYGTLLAMKDVK